MFMSSHVYDVAPPGKTVKNVALVLDRLATPDPYTCKHSSLGRILSDSIKQVLEL